MKRWIPSWTELSVFAAMAVICAGVVSTMNTPDLAFASLACPIFIVAGIMGFRHHAYFTTAKATDSVPEDESDSRD